jgi:hypothetical protein
MSISSNARFGDGGGGGTFSGGAVAGKVTKKPAFEMIRVGG